MFILHDPSSRMTKLSYMIKRFQTDVRKTFYQRSMSYMQASLCKAFTILIIKYDISGYKNAIKMVFSVPFVLR